MFGLRICSRPRRSAIIMGAALLAVRALPVHAEEPDAGVPSDAGTSKPGELFLPGTQPKELTKELRSPELCAACHGGYADYAANDTWQGTMMANAARDPLFHAALTVANQDIPGSGELCIRCHSPRAWLFGRSSPPLISNFEKEDFEGVQCDFCHRLTESPSGGLLVGTGQYFVADDFVRRGPIDKPEAPHDWKYAAYFSESRLCAVCHDVSNPLRGGFAIERTYSEWLASSFATQGTTCQTCHLPEQDGKACGAPGMPTRKVHRHELAGGNYWMPKVLAAEYPELGRAQSFERTAKNAERMLENAASVSIRAPAVAPKGAKLAFEVRVENKTGHKLPTGYPEGRRCWLEVKVTHESGRVLLHSGAYDFAKAERNDDAFLRTYEVRMAAAGKEGFHFILQDELLADTRIPPLGFVPAPDTKPVGREYPVVSEGPKGQILAHWDDAPYSVEIPQEQAGKFVISATLLYQTTSREYIEALRDANVTDNAGARLYALWEKHDRAPPFAASRASAEFQILEESIADAGVSDASLDADTNLSPAPRVEARASGGCAYHPAKRPRNMPERNLISAMTLVLALGILRKFRKRRTQCELGQD